MAQAQKVTNIGDKKGDKKAAQKNLFKQTARYTGTTAKLTLQLKELPENAGFRVLVVREKAGQKKDRGMVTDVKTKEQAIAKFDEIAAQCVAAGWALKAGGATSAFTEIPKAE